MATVTNMTTRTGLLKSQRTETILHNSLTMPWAEESERPTILPIQIRCTTITSTGRC